MAIFVFAGGGIFCNETARRALYASSALRYTNVMPFVKQTHFVGVPLPDELCATLETCRAWMNARYGCKSGHATPLHVTIVPPFCLDEKFTNSDLRGAMQDAADAWLAANKKLVCEVSGFGAFSTRTIFAHVAPSAEWTLFRDIAYRALLAKCPGTAKRDARVFTPHITVANRDIPSGAMRPALEHFETLHLQERFEVRSLALFARNARGGWTEDAVIAW